MMDYSYMTCKYAVSRTKLPGLSYSLNPYFGCEHGCIYCYVPSVFHNDKIAKNWGRFVKAKINIVDALSNQLKKIPKGIVGISTVTDPYQPIEARLQLTRKCIEVLLTYDFPISIQTKSPLVFRDSDIIKPRRVDLGVTITTLDKELCRTLEPRAPLPDSLIQVLEDLSNKGVSTWIFFGPIIPKVNDDEDEILRMVHLAKRTKSELIYDRLNLRRWVLDSMSLFLEKERPGLKGILSSLVADNSGYWKALRARIETICSREGVHCKPAFP
jgi:DNA repair photolyase